MHRSLWSALLGVSIGLGVLALALMAWVIYDYVQPPAQAAVTRTLRPTPTAFIVQPLPTFTPNPNVAPTPFTPLPPTPLVVPSAEAAQCGLAEPLTIVLLGLDKRPGDTRPTRTDAIALVRIEPQTASAAILSIPRDLYVPLPNLEAQGISQSRINTAYLYGEIYGVPGGGPAEVKDAIAWNFAIPVDRYVLMDFSAFVKVIDTLGGIMVDVPKPINDAEYPTDDGGVTLFTLNAGQQVMDGQTALRYVRTRHQDNDYGRMQRQQDVLLAIRDRALMPEVIPQWPALIANLMGLAQTDLAVDELARLACVARQIDRAHIRTYAINGPYIIPWTTPTGGSVILPNREALAPLINSFLNR